MASDYSREGDMRAELATLVDEQAHFQKRADSYDERIVWLRNELQRCALRKALDAQRQELVELLGKP